MLRTKIAHTCTSEIDERVFLQGMPLIGVRKDFVDLGISRRESEQR